MRRIATLLTMACACTLGLSAAYAGAACCKSGKSASKEATAKSGSCAYTKSLCAGEAEAFPSFKVKVGDRAYDCSMEAKTAAREKGGKVVFIVAGREFENHEKAMNAYACAAECYAKSFVSIACEIDGKWVMCGDQKECGKEGKGVKTAAGCGSKSGGDASLASAKESKKEAGCGSKSAADASLASAKDKSAAKCSKFRVAGHVYSNYEDAVKARKLALEAVKAVRMTYRVDGKDYDCMSKVCPAAREDGKVQFVVDQDATPCETTAKVRLAQKQVEAAKKAVDRVAKV